MTNCNCPGNREFFKELLKQWHAYAPYRIEWIGFSIIECEAKFEIPTRLSFTIDTGHLYIVRRMIVKVLDLAHVARFVVGMCLPST